MIGVFYKHGFYTVQIALSTKGESVHRATTLHYTDRWAPYTSNFGSP